MFTPDKHITEPSTISFTDYSKECPKGLRKFFSFVTFDDLSSIHIGNIFAANRAKAFAIVRKYFADSVEYIYEVSLQESDY